MKIKLLFVFGLLSMTIVGQTTHELTWKNDGSDAGQEITIDVGDTVRWTWGSGFHNLRAVSGTESFDSGFFSTPGHTFSYTFTQVGETNYVCDPHATNMYGTVTVVDSSLSIDENQTLKFNIYPNPSADRLEIQLPTGSENATATIFDVSGSLVISRKIDSNTQNIGLEVLSKGVYILQVSSRNKVGTKKFLKQ